MKAVILAGGLGTRLSEETSIKPKPMVEIGGMPILWHILKIYSHHGIHDFIICCGYKGEYIKEYFNNYFLHRTDITFNMSENSMEVHKERAEPWKITLVDTGINAMTGGRLAKVKDFVKNDPYFCFTYGDGVADVNITELIEYHKSHGKKASLTAVYPPGRFGALEIENGQIKSFREKPQGDGALINGGYFVLHPSVIDLITDDQCTWEQEPLNTLSELGELMAYTHDGFWQPMDTLRDKHHLEELWQSNNAPWKLW